MSEKKFIIYYSKKNSRYFYANSSWVDINDPFLKPILYSDDFKLIQKVHDELNEQLRK